MGERYRIELNERQLRIIYRALEEFFRISLGQCEGTARRLAYRDATPENEEDFSKWSMKGRHAALVMEVACEIATGRKLVQEPDEVIATDMWRILKEKIFMHDEAIAGYPVSQQSGEPPIRVNRLEGSD